MAQSMSGPTAAADDLEDDVAQSGRLISSRWRPHSLRTAPSREDRGLFGHPRGLPWMLNVEMWERFSYYGMRAILLYFITDTVARGGLGLSANSGQVVIALYGMAVYLLAIPRGHLRRPRHRAVAVHPLRRDGHHGRAHLPVQSPWWPPPGSVSCWWPWAPASSSRTCPRSSGPLRRR